MDTFLNLLPQILLTALGALLTSSLKTLFFGAGSRRAARSAGKRLQYAIWYEYQSGPTLPKLMKLARSLLRFLKRQPADSRSDNDATVSSAQIFVWNSGDTDITENDIFPNKPISLTARWARIKSCSLIHESDEAIVGRPTLHQNPSAEASPDSSIGPDVKIPIVHLAPQHGFCLGITFSAMDLSKCRLDIKGPLASLKHRRCVGTLWRVDLRDRSRLGVQAVQSLKIYWLSILGMLLVALYIALHLHAWVGMTYVTTLVAFIWFQTIYMSYREKYVQLKKKIPVSVAYWNNQDDPLNSSPTDASQQAAAMRSR